MIKKFLFLFVLFSSQAFSFEPLPTAQRVEINRYVGKWYSITSLPQFFTLGCVAQTADYGIINSKTISVVNTCLKKNGRVKDINGKATVVDARTNARLEVQFDSFWTRLFNVKGEYVIIKLSDDYEYVMIGSTDRKSLWIMARTPYADPEVIEEYKAFAKKIGFKTNKLVDSEF